MTTFEVEIDQASIEKLRCMIVTDSDPTSATIEFNMTTLGAQAPSVWLAGEWAGPAAAQGGGWFERVARTPLIGTGSLDPGPGRYQLWARLTIGSEQAVLRVGEVLVR